MGAQSHRRSRQRCLENATDIDQRRGAEEEVVVEEHDEPGGRACSVAVTVTLAPTDEGFGVDATVIPVAAGRGPV